MGIDLVLSDVVKEYASAACEQHSATDVFDNYYVNKECFKMRTARSSPLSASRAHLRGCMVACGGLSTSADDPQASFWESKFEKSMR
jgi:hypothetical protein